MKPLKKKLKYKNNSIIKIFFERLYILPIFVILIILFIDSYNNQITNSKVKDHLVSLPQQYSTTEAISNENMVINRGVITNLDKLHEFYNKVSENKETYFIFTAFNSENLPVIKSVLYKNKKYYINVDESRVNANKPEINSYTFTEMTKIDNELTLQLKFSNSDNELSFFNYNKTNGNLD